MASAIRFRVLQTAFELLTRMKFSSEGPFVLFTTHLSNVYAHVRHAAVRHAAVYYTAEYASF